VKAANSQKKAVAFYKHEVQEHSFHSCAWTATPNKPKKIRKFLFAWRFASAIVLEIAWSQL